MKPALEPTPILVAAGIGVVLSVLLLGPGPMQVFIGAGIGASVQIGVRLTGVS